MIPRIKVKNGGAIGSIFVFCLIILVLIWSNYLHLRDNDKKETIRDAIGRNSNLVGALEQYAIRTIHNADAVLQLVRMEYEERGNALDIDQILFNNRINTEIIKGIGIINKEGKLVITNLSLKNRIPVDLSDRDFFQFHIQNTNDTIFISRPVISKTIDKPVVIISRRINFRDGSFKGVVALQIEPSTFTSFYAQANLNPNDIISLISPAGITYARRTGAVESSGENIIRSPLFTHLKNNPDSFYFASDAIRHIPTWFSYRKFKNYPVIATVGISEQDVLSGYYRRLQRDLTSTIIISILVILFSSLFCFALIHRRKMSNKMIREEQRYQKQLTEQIIAAQERERERIGHELHDNINQVLTTVKLYMETSFDRKELRDQLIPKCIGLVMSTINEIRHLSHDLSAPTLGTRSLVDSIDGLIETVASSSGLKIYFDHEGYRELHNMKQKLALYRIAQEQLNNVIKHANAATVWISLSQSDGNTCMSIKDNGKGFNPIEQREGIGLNNIKSRVSILNGIVEINSQPGCGCGLYITLPSGEYEPVLN